MTVLTNELLQWIHQAKQNQTGFIPKDTSKPVSHSSLEEGDTYEDEEFDVDENDETKKSRRKISC